MSWFYYTGRIFTRIVLFLFTRWQVRGRENVPAGGPLLVVSNHLNLADPPVLGVSIPRKMAFMAKEELFRSRFTGYFIRAYGAFPVDRKRADRYALQQARELLSRGMALVMFPEGKRSRNNRLQKGFPGSALIALENGAAILPVGITGTEHIRGLSWLFRRPRITINIGRPFRLSPVNGEVNKTALAGSTDLIMEHIAGLLPEEYKGDYNGKKT